MNLRVLGSSPPYPSQDTPTSGYLLRTCNTTLLLECGHGIAACVRTDTERENIDGILITHMHPDHFFDLIALRNIIYHASVAALPLWVPSGADVVLDGLVDAMSLPADYFACAYRLHVYAPGEQLDIGDLRIRTAETIHPVPTALIDARFAGRRVVYTADTAWFDGLVELSRGCDILLAECTNYPRSEKPEAKWHLGPEELAALISDADVGRTVITHYELEHGPAIRDAVLNRLPADRHDVYLAGEIRDVEI